MPDITWLFMLMAISTTSVLMPNVLGRAKVQALAWVMVMYGVLGRISVGSSERSSAWVITKVFMTLIMPATLIMASIITTGTVPSRTLPAEINASAG